MLTGDTNLVDVDLIIQYRVADPVAFQLGMAAAEETLSGVVFAVTKDRVATMGVDVLLTTGRTELQQGAAASANALLDRLQTGLHVDAVEVREITPPPDVLDAFKDVSSARGDARRWLWQRKRTHQSACLRFGVSLRKRSRRQRPSQRIVLRGCG